MIVTARDASESSMREVPIIEIGLSKACMCEKSEIVCQAMPYTQGNNLRFQRCMPTNVDLATSVSNVLGVLHVKLFLLRVLKCYMGPPESVYSSS